MTDPTFQTAPNPVSAQPRRTPWPVGITTAVLILIVLGLAGGRQPSPFPHQHEN
jgi:hypothetical protein